MELLTIPPSLETLSSLANSDLEVLRSNLERLRHQILTLQNSRSSLLRLPGEIRNQIFSLAMRAELEDRTAESRGPLANAGNADPDYAETFFAPPAFLRACRRIQDDCLGVWFEEMVVWEEWCGAPTTATTTTETATATANSAAMKAAVAKATTTTALTTESPAGSWRRMTGPQIRELRALRAKLGHARVVMRRAFCDEEKLKAAVEQGWGMCARKGVVRVENVERPCGMRWWIW